MPDGWAASASGFSAITEHVAFLMKDLGLFAVSFYLLKEGVIRASELSAASGVEQAWSRNKAHIANSTGT